VPEELLAELREAEATRRPDHEPLAETLFEDGDSPRDRRLRQSQPFGGAAEAPRVGDPGEDQEVVRLELSHWQNNHIRFEGFSSERWGHIFSQSPRRGLRNAAKKALEINENARNEGTTGGRAATEKRK
jgi:hypothetical protein